MELWKSHESDELTGLSQTAAVWAGKQVKSFSSFILTYGKDLQIYEKAAGWRKVHGIYSTHCSFICSPIVFILSPLFEFPTIEQSEERKERESSHGDGKNCKQVTNLWSMKHYSSTTILFLKSKLNLNHFINRLVKIVVWTNAHRWWSFYKGVLSKEWQLMKKLWRFTKQ